MELLECVSFIPGVVAAACASVCGVEIVSPLYPTSRITRGSVLFVPGDGQSVLALQYTEKKTSLVVGPSILQVQVR